MYYGLLTACQLLYINNSPCQNKNMLFKILKLNKYETKDSSMIFIDNKHCII